MIEINFKKRESITQVEESNDLADTNNDGLVNIIDIVQLVDIILQN